MSVDIGNGVLLSLIHISPRVILQRGLVVSLLSLLAALSGWLGRICSERLLHLSTLMRPPVCLIIYLALFLPFYFLCRHNNLAAKCPALHPRVALACSFVPLGTMLVLCFSSYDLPQTLAYGIGVGAGYLLALLLHHTLNRQLQMNQVPASLQGAQMCIRDSSPSSEARKMMNCPGWAFFATRGASMTIFVTVGLSACFSRI